MYRVGHICSAVPVSLGWSKQRWGEVGACAVAVGSGRDWLHRQRKHMDVPGLGPQSRRAEDCPSLLGLTLVALLSGTGLSLSALCC